jgi:phosphoglucomutase/phosphomannomutase
MTRSANGETKQTALNRVAAAVAAGALTADSEKNLTRWLTEPHYANYVAPILELVDAERFDELDAMFWEVIRFGTGGRRGRMGEFGTATINERTIAESAHGLAVYLKSQSGKAGGRAVVAYDTRNRSAQYARLTATTFAANGLKVFLFDSYRSTPELSFAVRHLHCDVGAMISASHNPPSDNGFKAYWSSGGQVLPPHDQGIIDCVYAAGEIPAIVFDEAVADGRIELVGEEVDDAYTKAVTGLSLSAARELTAVYTPLHGVGETSLYRVLSTSGFSDVEIFESQRAADGNFSNVPDQLPNPERPKVFEPAIAHARDTGASLVLASDPDADRLGVSVKNRGTCFEHLSGNQIGALLADYILRKRSTARTLSKEHYLVQTLVTTPLIADIANAHGVRAVDDLLVGFKYIGETMDREGPDKFVFGAEESLGYLAGDYCRDKDASIAALYLMEAAAELAGEGKTLLDRLDDLYREHGYYVEGQHSEVCQGPQGRERIDAVMHAFRASPPTELAGMRLSRVRDYGQHEIRRLPDNLREVELLRPAGDLLFFESEKREYSFSVAVRPSGTEPKIKFYFFAHADLAGPASLEGVKKQTDRTLLTVRDALSGWVRVTLANRD